MRRFAKSDARSVTRPRGRSTIDPKSVFYFHAQMLFLNGAKVHRFCFHKERTQALTAHIKCFLPFESIKKWEGEMPCYRRYKERQMGQYYSHHRFRAYEHFQETKGGERWRDVEMSQARSMLKTTSRASGGSHLHLIFNHQTPTADHQPSTINHQESTINNQLSRINHQQSTINNQI